MFGKLFSRSTSQNESKNDTVKQEDFIQIIEEAISSFTCDIFPDGLANALIKKTIESRKNDILVELKMPFPCASEFQSLANQLSETLSTSVVIRMHTEVKPVKKHQLPHIKNIVAIASGKGGVGKSTTTVNLALALMAEGASVGILDADIYGPSIPTLLGKKNEKPTSVDGKLMQPIMVDTEFGSLVAMSIGFLVPDEQATVWRGPMASSAFNQLLNETAWPELDYLLIDMPPGTGDIQLTLAQKVPVAASVIITTPQDIALIDAVKGIAMFEKVKVPVLGIIENMSYHLCENCGHHADIFGTGGGERIAKQHNVALLGQLPLNAEIRISADQGENNLFINSTSDLSQQYRKIARNVAANLYWQLDKRSPQNTSLEIEIIEVN